MHRNPFPNITLFLQHGSYNTPARDYRPIGEAREIETVDRNPYKYKYNGKELQDELGLNVYDYGLRNYDAALGRFFNMDRFSEKYPNISTYAYTANSPTRFVDVRGDSLWITFGGKNQHKVLYQNGRLLNADGSRYEGKGVKVKKDGSIKITNSFLKKAAEALGELGSSSSATGAEMIVTLQASNYNFNITSATFNPASKGRNEFIEDNNGAWVGVWNPNLSRQVNQIGSGGTIYWNPSDPNAGTLATTKGSLFNPTTNLAHELAHGWDANFGLLSQSPNTSNGLLMMEGRASYIENQIRSELNYPLRTLYRRDGVSYNLLDSKNNPIPYGAISNPTMNYVSKVFSIFNIK